jgi:hypothetical protein
MSLSSADNLNEGESALTESRQDGVETQKDSRLLPTWYLQTRLESVLALDVAVHL